MKSLKNRLKFHKKYEGKKYGRLTVIGVYGFNKYGAIGTFSCECGNIKEIQLTSVTGGDTTSCGCYFSERLAKRNRRYEDVNLIKTKEYLTWNYAKSRCKRGMYKKKGIKMCESWLNSFEAFYEDMGDAPSKKHSIERIDNDGDYTPENCKWATRDEQINNRSVTIKVTHNGETKTISQWSRFYGIHFRTLFKRYHKGYTGDKLFFKGNLQTRKLR